MKLSEVYYIYCHVNKINHKIYFGITCREPYKRWGSGGCNYKGSPHFYCAIQKYGWDNFEHIVLKQFFNQKDCEIAERFLIQSFKTYDPQFGYNIEMGGNYNGKHSKDTCEKISRSKIGKPRSEETKQKVSQGLMGKMSGSKNVRSKAVICLTTGEIYESMCIASKATGIGQSDISRCCNGKIKQSKGTKWQYYQGNNERR